MMQMMMIIIERTSQEATKTALAELVLFLLLFE